MKHNKALCVLSKAIMFTFYAVAVLLSLLGALVCCALLWHGLTTLPWGVIGLLVAKLVGILGIVGGIVGAIVWAAEYSQGC